MNRKRQQLSTMNVLGVDYVRIITVLVSISLFVSCASTEDRTRDALLQGDRLLAQGKCGEATQHYAEAAELTPNSADIHLKLARTHARCGSEMAAIKEYKAAIAHGASGLEVYREIVPLFIKIGENKGAEAILQKIISQAPSDCVAYNNLGVVLHRQKRNDAARKAFEKAIKINPSHADSYLNLAALLENEFDDLATATKYYKKYLSLRPNARNAANIRDRIVQNELKLLGKGSFVTGYDEYMEQGRESLSAGLFSDAEEAFRLALRTRPTSSSARENLGVALMEQGKLREARQVLQKCLNQDGGSAGCAYQLGWTYQLSGNTKKAVEMWKKALRIDPAFKKARRAIELYSR
jgi:tetratricopeptide (TPR) repeat protein